MLIPLPEAKDFLIQAEKKEVTEHSKTLTQTEYVTFFSRCVASLKERLPRDYVAPLPRAYYQIQSGVRGVHFEWAFHGRPRSSFGVELHFEKGNLEQNQALLAACARRKDRLEATFGEPVVVQKEWGRTWARLYVEKQQGEITDDLRDWAVERMLGLIQGLQPELDKSSELTSASQPPACGPRLMPGVEAVAFSKPSSDRIWYAPDISSP